jgi:hypothetical protein
MFNCFVCLMLMLRGKFVVGVVLSSISLRKGGGVREWCKCPDVNFLLLMIDCSHSL